MKQYDTYASAAGTLHVKDLGADRMLTTFEAVDRLNELTRQRDALQTALVTMLYIFDRDLPAESIGRMTCDEARAALVAATPVQAGKETE